MRPDQHVGGGVARAVCVTVVELKLTGLFVLEVLLLLATLDADAELHAMRSHQLGHLVAELQRVVVGVDVRCRGPHVADLAAAAPAVEQLRRQFRTRRIRELDAVERDAASALCNLARILPGVVEGQAACS